MRQRTGIGYENQLKIKGLEMTSEKTILDRFRLADRVALVTGGGSGIGRGFAHALAQAGAKVAVVDLSRQSAETVAHELSDSGSEAIAVTADVTKTDQVQKMVETVVGHWDKLTIGVNNAGIAGWFDAESMPEAE